jgi:carboxypeptidase Taq
VKNYDALLARYADLQALNAATGIMSWDQQVLMPAGGTPARTAHLGRLSRMRHELLVSEETLRWVEEAAKEVAPGTVEAANVRAIQRELAYKTKMPTELIERKTAVSSEAYEVWKRAKAGNDFPAMQPYYEQLFDIARETSELLGSGGHIYDPLIDLFEEGAKYEDARQMFETIKAPISNLVKQIRDEGLPVDDSALAHDFDRPRLRQFAEETTAQIGFDFSRGRLDLAPNAFCGGASRGDIRMTTRASDHFRGIMSSSLHEMGHGLYEQGSPAEWDRLPVSGGASPGVHESQSRLWENIVGRSAGFWKFFLPRLKAVGFPEMANIPEGEMWRMMSKVEPSFIRVGADELTYNLHILVRFELEVEILSGKLAMKDLPEAWNAKYTEYLGITPPNAGLGCLQDVHWSRGSVGYFPTYAMGNLMGGSIWAVLLQDLGDVEADMSRGDFTRILGWLQQKIYTKAKLMKPRDLMNSVTGRYLDAQPWLDYATAKYRAVYGL